MVAATIKYVLDFKAKGVGLQTLRNGALMVMYLNNIPVYTIMLIGWRNSNAFLRYIHCQVKEFSDGVSSATITPAPLYSMFPKESLRKTRVPQTTNIPSAPGTIVAWHHSSNIQLIKHPP
jgi:hypothetical protein